MDFRSNLLRAVRFEYPEYIPIRFVINSACWNAYEHETIFELMESHRFLFPEFTRPDKPYVPSFGPISLKGKPFTDDFGCIWTTSTDGILGTVVFHPLENWNNYKSFQMPDPTKFSGIGSIDWGKIRQDVAMRKKRGELTSGGLRHGHTFLQLSDLRGYQNLIFDFADEEPKIFELIEKIEKFNAHIVNEYANIGVDIMNFPDDLGMQSGPMLSPEHFRKYIFPSYKRLIKTAKDKGCVIHMHSDGDIRALADDIIEAGVDIINLQDLVNKIDWIADKFKGRTAVDLDIDRQRITPLGTPKQIEELIREEVIKIGSKQGGIIMTYGWYPGIPVENIKALMDTLEKYQFYY